MDAWLDVICNRSAKICLPSEDAPPPSSSGNLVFAIFDILSILFESEFFALPGTEMSGEEDSD